jgi:hypothetical protein
MSVRPIMAFMVIAALCSLFVSCSQTQIAGGTDTETGGTKVTGSIRKSDGTPAPATIVTLIPAGYNPATDTLQPHLLTDTTNSDGLYQVRTPTKGRYNIQAIDLVSRSRLLLYGIDCEDSAVNAPIGTLSLPGSIGVFLPDSIDAVSGYCYIPGTSLFVTLETKTNFVFIDSVPVGIIPSILYGSLNSSTATIIRYNIVVDAGDTATVYNPAWKYSRKIVLNTSASGAGVSVDIANYPVLIRLTANNFDFSQVQSGGADIRFTKQDNSFLFYEIERWDAGAQKAEIWVKVDTVRGDNSNQFVSLYWGNASAATQSNAAAVFDTASCYQGVWHLGDAAGDPIHDATANHYNGGSPDTARPSIADGVIGTCRRFNGVADCIKMPNTAEGKLNFPEEGFYTVSAWVFVDTFGAKPQLIISKGYEQYYLWASSYPNGLPHWGFYEFNETTNWESSSSPATDGRWALLAGVRQGKNQFLYCNGVLVDSVKAASTWGISRDSLNDLSIGGFLEGIYDPAYEGYCFLKGSIDEVRIIGAAQSPDWLLLCFMNQRPDDKLVNFK